MSVVLTDRQQEVLDLIKSTRKHHRRGPTIREIGSKMGIVSPNGVVCHLKALERKGVIVREPNTAGGLKIAKAR